MTTLIEGRLLVSRPEFRDPNFDGTITLILEHNEVGALGLILNRPSTLAVADPFPAWEDLAAEPGLVHLGGPVEQDALLALGIDDDATGDLPLGLRSIDLDAQPPLVKAEGVHRVRVFAGYAGWGGGQLEGELSNDAWWVTDAVAEDVFCPDPGNLWARVLRRSGGELEWYAHFPADASLN